MKMDIGQAAGLLLLVALVGLVFWGIYSTDQDDQAIKQACLDNPTWETCKPCADKTRKDFDVCDSILANLALERRK